MTLIFLLGVLCYFLAGRRYEQPEQGQDCLGSAWLCAAFAVCLSGRWEVPGERCVPGLPVLSVCPEPQTESLDCVILISSCLR